MAYFMKRTVTSDWKWNSSYRHSKCKVQTSDFASSQGITKKGDSGKLSFWEGKVEAIFIASDGTNEADKSLDVQWMSLTKQAIRSSQNYLI